MEQLTRPKYKEKEFLLENGEIIKHGALHARLRRKYGKAKSCIFCHILTAKKYEYALITGKSYSLNIEDYLELCTSCHRKYDMTEQIKIKISKSKKGIKPSKEVIELRKIAINKNPIGIKVFDTITMISYRTITEAAKSIGIKSSTLQAMLNGQNPNKTNIRYYGNN
jgi:hypothetical protein